MKITILGSGTSHGVPTLDCMLHGYARCPQGVCRKSQTNPRHHRTRASIMVEHEYHHILVDVSADFREQMLREQIRKIDAVLITHGHADHIMGLPDIRSYTYEPAPQLAVYGSNESCENLKVSFSYIFDPSTVRGGGIPRIVLNPINHAFDLFGIKVTPLPVVHGGMRECYGYLFNNVAYIPDVKEIPESTYALLSNVDTLILNCIRRDRPHSTHLVLPESIAVAQRIAPRECYFTHLSHDIDYETDTKTLDSYMHFAYDGLSLNIKD